MKNLLSLLLLITLIGCAPAPETAVSHSKEDVAAAFDGLVQAILDRDKDKLRAIADPDVVWGHTGGARDDMEKYIYTNSRDDYNYTSITPSDQQIRIYGDVAIVRNMIDAEFYQKEDNDVRLKISMVTTWHHRDGQWLLVDRQGALIEEVPIVNEGGDAEE